MDYKRGDRYRTKVGTVYEYVGYGHKLVVLCDPEFPTNVGKMYSFPHYRDEYLGNFDKSNKFKEIYKILNDEA
jgi:hypothetical protein